MKKISIFLALIFVLLCFTGCGESTGEKESFDGFSSLSSEEKFSNLQLDWPEYNSVDKIINASSNIFIGEVISIDFEIIDLKTGAAITSFDEENNNLMLYTVYTIQVKDSLKGKSTSEYKLRRIGGTIGYKEDIQYDLLEQSDLLSIYGGTPVVEKYKVIDVGETYLFCATEYDFVINPYQFAYKEGSDMSNQITNSLKNYK